MKYEIDILSEVFFPQRKGVEFLTTNEIPIPLSFYGDQSHYTTVCYMDWTPNFRLDGSVQYPLDESYLVGQKFYDNSPQHGRLFVGKEFILGIGTIIGYGKIIEVEKPIFQFWSLNDEIAKLQFQGFTSINQVSQYHKQLDNYIHQVANKANVSYIPPHEEHDILKTVFHTNNGMLDIQEFNLLLATHYSGWEYKTRIERLKTEELIQYLLWDNELKLFQAGEIRLKRSTITHS